MLTHILRRLCAVPSLVLALLLSSCGFFNTEVSYKPPFLPIMISYDFKGKFSIKASKSIVTPVGSFSLGVSWHGSEKDDEPLILVVRHRAEFAVMDDYFTVTEQRIDVEVDGLNTVEVTRKRVVVDASAGQLRSITVRDPRVPRSPMGGANIHPTWWLDSGTQWNRSGPGDEHDPAKAAFRASRMYVFGKNSGTFMYSFYLPSIQGGKAEVSAWLSSYSVATLPMDYASDVLLIVNGEGKSVKRVTSGADRHVWTFDSRALKVGENSLAFSVSSGPDFHNGLCIHYQSVTSGVGDVTIDVRTYA